MSEFLATLVAELRQFSAQLLERGLAPAASASTWPAAAGGSTFSHVLHHIDTVANLLPHLLDELDTEGAATDQDLVPRRTPVRAEVPRRPDAFAKVEGRILPTYFLRAEPRVQPNIRPLGFVLHVLEQLSLAFGPMHARLTRHLTEARATRQGTSQFAQHDLQELDALERTLDRAELLLRENAARVRRTIGGASRTLDRLPHPFPRSPSWQAFRRVADAILRPEQFLGRHLSLLTANEMPIADLPFLYQRWVGARLLRILDDDFGFAMLDDPVGALFLGGRVRLLRGTTTLWLWCEPRLERTGHASGLIADGAEATPDYVLITPGRGGPDAFVLDATLSQDPTLLEQKARYRDRISFAAFRRKAGVPGRQRPLRAWAAAPVAGTQLNRLTVPDGSCGVVPMHPTAGSPEPLREWLREIVDHADAWQLLAEARRDHGASQASTPGGGDAALVRELE